MSKRRAYTVEFKIEAVKFAETHSNRETARKFQVDESMVRRWVQNKANLNAAYDQPGPSKKKLKLGCGRKPCLSTIEDKLMEKIAHEREQQHHVSSKLITVWAKTMADENGLTEFAASRGWLCNFLRRFNLTLRRRTTTEQSVPHDLEEKISSLIEFNKKQRDLHKFLLSMIANMDEILLWADVPSATTDVPSATIDVPSVTVDKKRRRAVPIRTTGHDENFLHCVSGHESGRDKGGTLRCDPS